jgi:hypothetical protein
MTPLLGRWLDLWLEAVQQGAGAGMASRRLQEYGELREGAAAKLRDSSYRPGGADRAGARRSHGGGHGVAAQHHRRAGVGPSCSSPS